MLSKAQHVSEHLHLAACAIAHAGRWGGCRRAGRGSVGPRHHWAAAAFTPPPAVGAKPAFAGAAPEVTSLNSSFPQHIQYVTNQNEGNVTVTLSYTGSSSTFNIPDGPLFNIKLTHSPSFFNYTTIDNMKITGVTAFTARASNIDGMDATLTMHNYGGVISPQLFNYQGTFTNVTGTPAKNLT